MNRVFTYEITEEWESIRDFLKMRRYPHAVFVKLKRTEGSVLVNGEWLHLYKPLHVGDILEIHLEEQESSENIVPRDFGEIVKPGSGLQLPIVYEDADLLVLNKPAGLGEWNSAPSPRTTPMSCMRRLCKPTSRSTNAMERVVPGDGATG